MSKKINKLLSIMLVFLVISCGVDDVSPSKEKKIEIHSVYTGFDYNISILFPEHYNIESAYNTIYLLDGGEYYYEVADVLNNEIEQEVVLISISYLGSDKRETDFTYPIDGGNTGGGKKFIQFFNTELIPYIETKLNITPIERTLYGHSYGGYFCIFYMFQTDYPVLFNNFISASAPLSFGNNYLIKSEQTYSENHTSLNHKWHISYGSLENDALLSGFMDKMSKRTYSGLEYKHETFKNLLHLNTPIVAFKNGLNFILN